MRYLVLFLIFLMGCTSITNDHGFQEDTKTASAFLAIDYPALSSLNMDPEGTANYLFGEVCGRDLFSSISPIGSDGVVASLNGQSVYRFYQTYHGAPVWGTHIEVLWDTGFRTPLKASLLVVDPAILQKLETGEGIPAKDALDKIERLFLAADAATNYEMMEPETVYCYSRITNSWHYGWGSTIVSHQSGFDNATAKAVVVNLEYSIIIDAVTGEQLLLEFFMRN